MNVICESKGMALEVIRETPDPWTFPRPDGAFDLGDIYLPMGDSDPWGDWDCRDWLKEGVDWWRREIATSSMDYSKTA